MTCYRLRWDSIGGKINSNPQNLPAGRPVIHMLIASCVFGRHLVHSQTISCSLLETEPAPTTSGTLARNEKNRPGSIQAVSASTTQALKDTSSIHLMVEIAFKRSDLNRRIGRRRAAGFQADVICRTHVPPEISLKIINNVALWTF
jgi:hypothetical protein